MSTQPVGKASARPALHETPENPAQGLKQLGNQTSRDCSSQAEGSVTVLGSHFKCSEANANHVPQRTSTGVTEQPFESCPFCRRKAAHAMCHTAVHTSAHRPCQLGRAREARTGTPSPRPGVAGPQHHTRHTEVPLSCPALPQHTPSVSLAKGRSALKR